MSDLVANMTFWKKEFDDALPFFERRLTSNEYLVSNTFTAADINVVLTLYFAVSYLKIVDCNGGSNLQYLAHLLGLARRSS